MADPEHYQERFEVFLQVHVESSQHQSSQRPLWESHSSRNASTDILFSSRIERDECFDSFGESYGLRYFETTHYRYFIEMRDLYF